MRDRVERLKRELADHIENVVVLDAAESTHGMASRLISEMDGEDQSLGSTLIVADLQEAGKGRGSRSWQSPAGGLYLSWLRSGVDSATIARLPMLAAACARDALTEIGVNDIEIKWPNDILVAGRKLAGILIFARHGAEAWVTVGLGVNLATAPQIEEAEARPATSVADLIGAGSLSERRHALTCGFVHCLAAALESPDNALRSWREHLVHRAGDAMSVRLASGEVVTGTLVEITDEGFLRIEHDGHDRVITGGDIVES